MKKYSKLQPLQLYVRKSYTVCRLYKHIIRFMARPGHRAQHILGLGYTCTCILLVKLIKRLQNIILPDALFLYVGQPIKTREESNIPYLSVVPICSVLPWKGRPNIKLIDTCGGRLTVSRHLLSIHSLNLQLIRTFFIIKIWFLLVLVVMFSHSHQASVESRMQEMYSIFLQQHELILISSDVTAHVSAFCGTRAHIFPSFFGKVVRAAISEL